MPNLQVFHASLALLLGLSGEIVSSKLVPERPRGHHQWISTQPLQGKGAGRMEMLLQAMPFKDVYTESC